MFVVLRVVVFVCLFGLCVVLFALFVFEVRDLGVRVLLFAIMFVFVGLRVTRVCYV